MAIQLGSAYGKVGLDVKGLLTAIKQGKAGLMTLAGVGENVGNAMKSIGRSMTLGLTLPILAMGAASIKAASDFEETKNKAVVVFGEMADAVVSNSNRAATSLGISKTQYLDYAASIGAALKAGGMGVKESAELAEQAVQHFADLASFHNAQVEEVAAAWQSAIRGQYEPIQRYFPFITDSYLKTYGIANGMLDANTKTLTANQRAVILNAIALNEELNPALNDFAETSDGLANSTRILKAQWQDALVLLGQNLLPMALKVVKALNQMLTAFNNLSPTQQKIIVGFLAMAAAAGPILGVLGSLISFISTIAGAASTLSGLGISFASIGTVLTSTVIPGVAALGAALIPIGIVLLTIAAILIAVALQVAIFHLAWKNNFLGIRDITKNAVANLKSLWSAFTSWLKGDNEAAAEELRTMWTRTMEMLQNNFPKLFNVFNNFVSFLRNVLTRIREYMVNAFSGIDWGKVGRYILSGLANGMLGGIPNLLNAAKKVAETLLAQIKKSLGIASDSKEAIKLGYFTGHGFMGGVEMGANPEAIARSLARPITNNSSSQSQTIIQNFEGGLTLRQVQGMIDGRIDSLANELINNLGGGA